MDGQDEAIVSQAFPEGSHAHLWPHYIVHFVGGDRNVTVPWKSVGVDRKPPRKPLTGSGV